MKVLAWPAFKNRYKNPYNWLLYAPMQELGVEVEELSPWRLLTGQYDVIHLHWPVETIVRHPNRLVAWLRVLMFIGLLRWQRWRGTAVAWTIHDQRPHVLLHAQLAQRCEAWLIDSVDGVINLCGASQQAMGHWQPRLAETPSFVVPHGHYRDVYPNQISAMAARVQLELAPESQVLLYLGYISPYKNVPRLIEAFGQIDDPNLVLVVAGRPDNETLRQAVQTTTDERVRLHLRYIADDEMQVFCNAADLVVLPFQAILNSGSVLLALSFNRPVLAPHMGAIPEWQSYFGESWVRTYEGKLTADVLRQAMTQSPLPGADASLDFGAWEWPDLAKQTVEIYRQLGGRN